MCATDALGIAGMLGRDVVIDSVDPQSGEPVRVAVRGGEARWEATAGYLLRHGADLDWVAPWDGLTPLDAARRSGADELAAWLIEQGARSAKEPSSTKD